jgi:adenine-specific DNA-methyltransferase
MNILKKDKRLWDENSLNKPLLFELLEKYDEELFTLLLSDKETKEKYFIKAGESYVFKYEDFRFFIEQNNLDGSYTKYIENSIGLSSKGKFLTESTDYVLEWPFKDTILEGGMSSEDHMDTYIEKDEKITPGKIDNKTGTVISSEKKEVTFTELPKKRQEIFYNNIIAEDEIDQLLKKKAFKNFKRYTDKGEDDVTEIKRDEDGTVKENLLIKGNNLLALYSLKEKFAGKVKLIYIDPPYNTGNDGFAYNDRFNHSTWLTFMKNRLEIAKDFLRDDGLLFVQCDDNEMAHLKVLLDEKNNKINLKNINTVVVKMSEASGVKMSHTSKKLPKLKEYILIYSKSENYVLNELITEKRLNDSKEQSYLKYYGKIVENFDDPVEDWTVISLKKYLEKTSKKELSEEEIIDFKIQNKHRMIYRTNNPQLAKLKFDTEFKLVESKTGLKYIWWEGKQALFLGNNKYQIKDLTKESLGDLWTDISTINLNKEGGVELKAGKKPEKLLKRIIELGSNPGDIVLDFHLGSGTTAAVALKLNRQFIGIEQMDYLENSPSNRLFNTIKGAAGGISKEIGWKGGGEFIYFELAKYNEEAKNKIDACASYSELKKLFTELSEYYFLKYNVSVKEFTKKFLNNKDFQDLPIDNQKKIFKALLDNNQLYISYDEQLDPRFKLSEKDKKLTQLFYE